MVITDDARSSAASHTRSVPQKSTKYCLKYIAYVNLDLNATVEGASAVEEVAGNVPYWAPESLEVDFNSSDSILPSRRCRRRVRQNGSDNKILTYNGIHGRSVGDSNPI